MLTPLSSIHHASRPTSHTSPVILYLPNGLEPPSTCATLALASNATVVCVHYRLSTQQPYPTPVHDVLAGYDWVQQHLGTCIDLGQAYPTVESANIGVCGELVGGGLASMLALTECRPTKGGVKAAAVRNAVLDWTSIFAADGDNASPAVTNRQQTISAGAKHVAHQLYADKGSQPLSNDTLLQLRSAFFQRAEKYFDPFASPLLFFRTPASELPTDIDGPTVDRHTFGELTGTSPAKKRRSHRKYPPIGSALRLPELRIEVGMENELRNQGEEMAEVLKKSVKYWEEEFYGACDREALLRKIQLVRSNRLGLWAEKDIISLGEWFGEVLRR